ncbi:hypothetical protein SAMN05421756_102267 [Microlunatus flavus]|uniref:Uncharacterized protein n=2 Tax=Microlunatus flavus TaxID=1036181 RepID=A0A1H9CN76_9ACTN|nr:hypothetical protein SAMN05421756_102267 [Microlunatus flavus]
MAGWLRGPEAVLADTLAPSTPRVDDRAVLRRAAAEAVILQDRAEAVLADVRAHGHLGLIAPRGGPLVRRFFSLRDELPRGCADPDDERLRHVIDVALHSHALVVSMSMDLLAHEWRSQRLADVVGRIEGLGAAAVALDAAYAELSAQLPHSLAT